MQTINRLIAVIAICAANLRAADVRIAWDCPTNNVDGTPLTDLTGFEVDAIRSGVTQTWTFAAVTNAPTGTVSQTNTLTGLQNAVYVYQVRAVANGGVESSNSVSISGRAGKPGEPKGVKTQ